MSPCASILNCESSLSQENCTCISKNSLLFFVNGKIRRTFLYCTISSLVYREPKGSCPILHCPNHPSIVGVSTNGLPSVLPNVPSTVPFDHLYPSMALKLIESVLSVTFASTKYPSRVLYLSRVPPLT